MSAVRVLLVEDEQEMVELMDRALRRKFEVEIDRAPSGVRGLQEAGARGYGLIVSDIRMPGLDGISMVEQIRDGTGPNCQTPVVLITGHHQEGEEAASRLGVRFLAKPFSRRRLLETLGDLLPPAG